MSVDFASTVVTACAIFITYAKSDMRDTWMKMGKKSQPSAIIIRNDIATYFAITE